MTTSLVASWQLVLFLWLNPSLIWAPLNAFSHKSWYLGIYQRCIKEEMAFKYNYIVPCIFQFSGQRFSKDRCQINWQHPLKIYFENSCWPSDANVDYNTHRCACMNDGVCPRAKVNQLVSCHTFKPDFWFRATRSADCELPCQRCKHNSHNRLQIT